MIVVQSYIDLITNSSTSVFQWASNVEGVKDIINAVLKASGSNLTCDDLFDIDIYYNIDLINVEDFYYNLACEKMENDSKLKDLVNIYDRSHHEDEKTLWKIYKYLVKHYNAKTLDEYAEEYNENSDDWMYSSSYIIEAKDPKNRKYEKALYIINNLFDYDARYC